MYWEWDPPFHAKKLLIEVSLLTLSPRFAFLIDDLKGVRSTEAIPIIKIKNELEIFICYLFFVLFWICIKIDWSSSPFDRFDSASAFPIYTDIQLKLYWIHEKKFVKCVTEQKLSINAQGDGRLIYSKTSILIGATEDWCNLPQCSFLVLWWICNSCCPKCMCREKSWWRESTFYSSIWTVYGIAPSLGMTLGVCCSSFSLNNDFMYLWTPLVRVLTTMRAISVHPM